MEKKLVGFWCCVMLQQNHDCLDDINKQTNNDHIEMYDRKSYRNYQTKGVSHMEKKKKEILLVA
jgi:hypothetical protein